MDNIKCFLIEKNGKKDIFLRRYRSVINDNNLCLDNSYHNAKIKIGETVNDLPSGDLHDHNDSRWPKTCTKCGTYHFTDEDEWQLDYDSQYAEQNTGNIYNLNNVPVGAIWRAEWYEDIPRYRGIDGKCYVVKTPGGDWVIDSVASNCTRTDDLIHKCWCRHGEAPNFTVDKQGNTCQAGAGSIMIGNYHGFLRNGYLTNC